MSKRFEPTGRPTVAEIDLGALEFNYRQLQKRAPRGVKFLAVVKADAYGHGAVPVSLRLEKQGVEYLGVATSEEGVELRRGGVKTPILILGGIYGGQVDEVLRYRLTPVMFQKEVLQRFSKEAERRRRKVKVHLKVDTGMGRLGVPVDHWPAFLKEIKRFSGIEVEGLLSHFSMTEEDEGNSSRQWREFQEAVKMAREAGISCKYLHMANSAALAAFPACSENLVRPGIMLYGCYPSVGLQNRVKLRPVLTLKTRIHFLKTVPPGSAISYGGTFVTRRETMVATLPIGYADGYSRRLSNQGEVIVRGKRAPVLGRVCMDLVMVDVTDIPGASIGDEAVLIGKQGGEQITADEIARKVGSIPYEVLCSIGKRVPRIYKNA